jgi:hypothetical protein
MKLTKLYLLLPVIFLTFLANAQTTNYQVYSLYVVNIAKYSSWPNVSGEFSIKFFGKSKVYDELLKQNGKFVNGRLMKIEQIDNLANIGQPQIIYIADNKSASVDDLVKITEGKSIMIISEREGMHKRGAGFSFIVTENGTLRCDINNTELEKRQIKVSKNLSSLTNSSI